ncbi:MAG: hypothetical protein R3300_10175 [Candidatus Promineifilaceae bacterium]|nr:hypothetical protein [Candidatus Promineifilaceae bacterium]
MTHVLEAMRATLNTGWDTDALAQGVAACLLLSRAMYASAVFVLRVRIRRS